MSDERASADLQVIRTLMERSALYRRALAPVMTVTGVIGSAAALAGWKAGIHAAQGFVLYWLGIAVVAVGAGILLIRRQAVQQRESFWSPPLRRVARAMLPPLAAGLMLGVITLAAGPADASPAGHSNAPGATYLCNIGLPVCWIVLYGCAIHAAGFFMQRGVRRLGWVMILLGCVIAAVARPETALGWVDAGYLAMGGTFGLLHLLYGLYLYATEKRPETE